MQGKHATLDLTSTMIRLLIGHCLASCALADGKETPSVEAIDSVIRATSPRQRTEAATALFRGASDRDVRALTLHQDTAVALTAAWQRVLRSSTQAEEPGPEPIKLRTADLHWFAGFAEGRLRLAMPPWWLDSLMQARALSRSSVLVPAQAMKNSPYHRTVTGYCVPSGLSVKKQGDFLELAMGDDSCKIPAATIWNSKGRGECLLAASDGGQWFVATHSSSAISYALMCVDRQSGVVRWVADVWTNSYSYGFTGISTHWAALQLDENAVTVIGLQTSGPYIETFRKADGKNLFRFGSKFLPNQNR